MAGERLIDRPLATVLDDGDVTHVVQGTQDKQATLDSIAEYFLSGSRHGYISAILSENYTIETDVACNLRLLFTGSVALSVSLPDISQRGDVKLVSAEVFNATSSGLSIMSAADVIISLPPGGWVRITPFKTGETSSEWRHSWHYKATPSANTPAKYNGEGYLLSNTPPESDNSLKAATTAFVKIAIAALINSSPAALDTLNELAAALGNDPNFATTMVNALAGKAPLDLSGVEIDSVKASLIDFGAGEDQVDSDLLPLGTAVESNPTGGTATSLAASSFVRDALTELFARLIDLSGVANDAVRDRHIDWGTSESQVNSANMPTNVGFSGSALTFAATDSVGQVINAMATIVNNLAVAKASYSSAAVVSITSTSPVLAAQFGPVPTTGYYIISFRLVGGGNTEEGNWIQETCYARIYKNGSAYGTLRGRGKSSSSDTGAVFTEALSFTAGDYIQIYVYRGGVWALYGKLSEINAHLG